jgi:hypothetical protein
MGGHVFRLTVVAASVFLGGIGIGCYTYEPVRFCVRDAESGEAIAKAKIEVVHPYVLNLFPPKDAGAVTDEHGDAVVRVADSTPMFTAEADGYIPPHFLLPVKGRVDRRQEVWLYRLPRPTVEIVLPDGYRGLLTITLEPTESKIQESSGKRHFVFRASAEGAVRIVTTPLLRYPNQWNFPLPVRYEVGGKIPYRDDSGVTALTVAVRPVLGGEGDQLLYVIGDESDLMRMEREIRGR